MAMETTRLEFLIKGVGGIVDQEQIAFGLIHDITTTGTAVWDRTGAVLSQAVEYENYTGAAWTITEPGLYMEKMGTPIIWREIWVETAISDTIAPSEKILWAGTVTFTR